MVAKQAIGLVLANLCRRALQIKPMAHPFWGSSAYKCVTIVPSRRYMKVSKDKWLNRPKKDMVFLAHARVPQKIPRFFGKKEEQGSRRKFFYKEKCKMLRINYYKLKKYFPQSYTAKQCEKALWEILDEWYNQHCA